MVSVWDYRHAHRRKWRVTLAGMDLLPNWRRVGLSLVCVVGAVAGSPAQAAPPPAPVEVPAATAEAGELAQRVLAKVVAFVHEQQVPGLSYAIARRGDLLASGGVGRADLEQDVPATSQTVYRLASISKPITAIAALQLAEQGQLDLDADVATLVADWPERAWPVTTRQLLGHLGGVRHYRAGEAESTEWLPNQTAGLRRFRDDELLHEPGSKYLYSTFGYNLVGAVVEQVGGQHLEAQVRERVAAPAGATSLQADHLRRIVKHRAAGYVRVRGELQNSALMDSSYKLGGGGFVASALDLAQLGSALLGDRLLRPDTRATMFTSLQTRDGRPTGYGLGFRIGTLGERRAVYHSGAQSRVSTMWFLLPDEQVVVAVLCNLERTELGPLARELAGLAAAAK